MKEKPTKKEEEFVNPIDADKIAENPGLLPYAHHAGSAIVKPEDKGKIKGRAVAAMEEQTHMHLNQIQEQVQLLVRQAKDIQNRKRVSELIYLAQINYEPIINHIYHLYRKKDDSMVMSLISPAEWGRSFPYEGHVATARLLADHTWDIMEIGDEEEIR